MPRFLVLTNIGNKAPYLSATQYKQLTGPRMLDKLLENV